MLKLLQQQIEKYRKQNAQRNRLKALSNEIRGQSKQTVALLRRDHVRTSKVVLLKIEQLIRDAGALIKKHPDLRHEGFYVEALEEYAEARVLYNFIIGSAPKFPARIFLSPEEIIGGICDATGELVRKAISDASVGTLKKIEMYRSVIEGVSQALTTMGLQGKLRHKYDDVERNLQKLENIIYDIKLQNR